MATLTIVAQAVYIPTTTNLYLIAILTWYSIAGPATFSLDRVLGPGIKQSALPLGRPLVRLGDSLRALAAPLVMLFVRLWLGLSLLAYAGVVEPPIAVQTWLTITSFDGMVRPFSLALRLFVAMMAGHVLLKVLSSFVIDSVNAGAVYGGFIGIPSFTLMIAISALEILVAGIQAYVFALLTSLYINDAEHLH